MALMLDSTTQAAISAQRWLQMWAPDVEEEQVETTSARSALGDPANILVGRTMSLGIGAAALATRSTNSVVYAGIVSIGSYSGVTASDPSYVVLSSAFSIADRVLVELGRVENGWAGPGTLAPNADMIEDVETVLQLLPWNASLPTVEVEDDGSSISLRWVADDTDSSRSIVFAGGHRATVVLATRDPPRSKTWRLDLTDSRQIASVFDEAGVNEAVVA